METAANASNNNSITMYPDGDMSVADPFVEHNTVSGNQFSPGQTVDGSNNLITSVENADAGDLPNSYRLKQNYPNPFNPTTSIGFDIPKSSHVSIKIYNINGQEVRTLTNKQFAPGSYVKIWNARNNSGNAVPSGLYFYQITADGFTAKNKMILLK